MTDLCTNIRVFQTLLFKTAESHKLLIGIPWTRQTDRQTDGGGEVHGHMTLQKWGETPQGSSSAQGHWILYWTQLGQYLISMFSSGPIFSIKNILTQEQELEDSHSFNFKK